MFPLQKCGFKVKADARSKTGSRGGGGGGAIVPESAIPVGAARLGGGAFDARAAEAAGAGSIPDFAISAFTSATVIEAGATSPTGAGAEGPAPEVFPPAEFVVEALEDPETDTSDL